MDIDLWLRLGALPRRPARGDLAVFREHAGSISSANKLHARQEEFRVRRRTCGTCAPGVRHVLHALSEAHACVARGIAEPADTMLAL